MRQQWQHNDDKCIVSKTFVPGYNEHTHMKLNCRWCMMTLASPCTTSTPFLMLSLICPLPMTFSLLPHSSGTSLKVTECLALDDGAPESPLIDVPVCLSSTSCKVLWDVWHGLWDIWGALWDTSVLSHAGISLRLQLFLIACTAVASSSLMVTATEVPKCFFHWRPATPEKPLINR